ncbi:uncharacterized protein LOC107883726 [Acyrthosiphon pisum]|uniref:Transposable element P transposase n=1 Tax=Acyrthosiphon pisum TaxID=7029 RepID=A0A8R2D476_ACYPI|nr:uncharacterized protein LOC107883726 [Acyrthosiphon pisum]|eukprot:XP_016659815.1 PREDICTED: uncharacterized protein LOC107883726 [Acyrthosiphon pisum]
MDGNTYTASWDHIVAMYDFDKKNEEFELRTLVKLNDNHINMARSKMKVSNAAQVFSHRVASTMKLVSDNAPKGSLLANAVGTAKFCLFMDKTFDSVNARTINPELGKPLRSAVTDKSPHIDHWKYAIKVFESMKFVNKTNGKSTIPPCIKNWIISLKSFLYLWIQLKKHNFKYFLPRHVNQDSLECFFGSVRSHGVRNINPDAYQFVCSFKTLLINNFTSIKSAGNCEHDDSDGTLDNLKQFIESGTNCSLKEPEENNIINIPMFDLPNTFDVCDFTDMTIGYISGYLARTVLKENKFCRLCKNILISNVKNNNLIRVRDYTTKSLLYPSESFQKIIYQMLYITKYILLT